MQSLYRDECSTDRIATESCTLADERELLAFFARRKWMLQRLVHHACQRRVAAWQSYEPPNQHPTDLDSVATSEPIEC